MGTTDALGLISFTIIAPVLAIFSMDFIDRLVINVSLWWSQQGEITNENGRPGNCRRLGLKRAICMTLITIGFAGMTASIIMMIQHHLK